MASMFLAPTLTPHGHLVLVEDSAAANVCGTPSREDRGTVCYSLGLERQARRSPRSSPTGESSVGTM